MKLTVRTPERLSTVFIVNFRNYSTRFYSVFADDSEQV